MYWSLGSPTSVASHGINRGLWLSSMGLYGYGLYSYGLYSRGLYRYGQQQTGLVSAVNRSEWQVRMLSTAGVHGLDAQLELLCLREKRCVAVMSPPPLARHHRLSRSRRSRMRTRSATY